jgi:hypothetical protein
MSPTLTWGLGVGLTIIAVDALASELTRGITDTDLAAAVILIDLLINLGLCGLAGYRVAAARGEIRAGLEAAVLAGLLAGSGGFVYQHFRGGAALPTTEVVFLIAWNVVLAAGAGALGAWGGSATRLEPPRDGERGPRDRPQ